MKSLLALLLSVLCLTLAADPVISHSERLLADQLLERYGIDSTSVNFLKDWGFDTQLKLPVMVDILNHPWKYPEYVSRLESLCQGYDTVALLDSLSRDLYGTVPEPLVVGPEDCCANMPMTPAQLLDRAEEAFEAAQELRDEAFADLTPDEIAQLRFLASTMWQEGEDSVRYREWRTQQGIREFKSLDLQTMTPVIQKIHFDRLVAAAELLQAKVSCFTHAAGAMKRLPGKPLVRKTPWGLFVFGTPGNDVYDRPCAFVIDPAGNDVYHAPWRTDFDRPLYLQIDVKGDDTYRNSEISGLFSVLGGVGVSYDDAGNDQYYGDDNTMTAFFGCQIAEDAGGDDIYRAGLYGLAAGTFGISLLMDDEGRDEYYLLEYGEGFGGTLGAGILADYTGNDLYFAGGKYLHIPLAPNDYRSMAQGFGFGVRSDWGGGIGMIYEGEGNDTYKGGVYSQAVAYWYALGMIVDEAGNDVYDSVYYPQGSGIHLAGGFLFDRAGDDHYYSKNGPGQGAAHDWAVGFLVDRAGDDIYSVPGGNGLALTNSVALFLDASGDDRYERSVNSNYGFANQSRDSGGLGLFMDLGGHDRYPSPDDTTKTFDFWRDNHNWVSDTYGFGIDTLAVAPTPKAIEKMAEEAVADVDSTASIDSLFAVASSWGVGSYEKRVKKAADYLLLRPGETAKYIYDTQLGSKDGLVWRAITDFAHRSDSLKKYIPLALHHPDSLWNKSAIALIADLSDSTYIDSLKALLVQKRYVASALSALGYIPSDRSAAVLETWIDCPSERYRVIVARGFKEINTPRAQKNLRIMLDDPSFTVRTIAKLALKK
jgi:hypothetical protein